MAPTFLICDDVTPVIYWAERLVSTKAPPADIIDVEKMFVQIQECADRMAAETLALVHEMRAQLIERPPQFGFHRPGLITPRRVDNADRSGANRFKIVNSVYGPRLKRFMLFSQSQAPAKVGAGAFCFFDVSTFCPKRTHLAPSCPHFCHFSTRNRHFLHFWKIDFFPVRLFNEQKTRPHDHGRTRRPRPS